MPTRDEQKYGDDIPQLEGISPQVKTLIRNLFRIRILKVSGFIALVLGALFIVMGAVAPILINDAINKEVVKKITIDCTCHNDYADWQKDDNTRRSFSFFNIDNLNEVLKGEKANLTEKGPYTYQLKREMLDVQFRTASFEPTEVGSLVSFKEWNMYVWDSANSCKGCSGNDTITTVNQAYLGAVAMAGGNDFGIYYGFADGAVKALTVNTDPGSFLGQVFLKATPAAVFFSLAPNNIYLRSVLRDASVAIQRKIKGSYTPGEPLDLDLGLQQWANCTYLNGSVSVPGFEIAYDSSQKMCTPLGITLETARKLFDTDNSKSTYALNNAMGYTGWYYPKNIPEIMQVMGMTQEQVVRVMNWFSPKAEFGRSTLPTAFVDGLSNRKTEYGAKSAVENPLEQGLNLASKGFGYETALTEQELGYLQWSNSFLTCGLQIASSGSSAGCVPSVADLDPTAPAVEFSAWATRNNISFDGTNKCDINELKKTADYPITNSLFGGQNMTDEFAKTNCRFFTLEQSKAIWDKSTGFGNPQVLATFVLSAPNWSPELLAQLKLTTAAEAGILAKYMGYLMTQAQTSLGLVGEDQCGLFCTKTVEQWLFGMPDPFLMKLTKDENASFQSYFPNITNSGDASKYINTSTWGTGYTGRKDVQIYRTWNETDAIGGGASLVAGSPWKTAEVITGTDGTQFYICNEKYSKDCLKNRRGSLLQVYEENLMRVVGVKNYNNEEANVKGIETLRLRLVQEALEVNAANTKYYMTETGVAPMKTAKSGVDMCFTKPYFLDADAKWSAQFKNFPHYSKGDSQYDLYDTILDMEPISGKVVRAQKQLQINYNLSAETLNTFYPGVQKNLLFPSFYLNENGVLSDSDASDLSSGLYDNQDLADALEIAGYVVGAVVFVTGIVCLVVAYKLRKKYTKGNEALLFHHKHGSSPNSPSGEIGGTFAAQDPDMTAGMVEDQKASGNH